MKLVEIREISGPLVVSGLMSKETYINYVLEHAPSFLPEAEHLWDTATLYSLKDYFGDVTIRVREVYSVWEWHQAHPENSLDKLEQI